MRKNIIFLIACTLSITIPAISAISIPEIQNLKKEIIEINNDVKKDYIPR